MLLDRTWNEISLTKDEIPAENEADNEDAH